METFAGKKDKIRRENYTTILLSATMTTVTHPIHMTKVLIQVGFEPVDPVPFRTFFGKDMYKLPNFFTYSSLIFKRDGIFGLFRGVTPRIFSSVISCAINNSLLEKFHSFNEKNNANKPSQPEMSFEDFAKETCYQTVSRATSTIITYPFQVVSLRMIIQFVGRETRYHGTFHSLREIYKEEGFSGLFAGLVPQLIGDLLTLWFFRTLTFAVNKAVTSEIGDYKDLKVYTQQASQIIVSSVTYPFTLVSNLMAVSNSSLYGCSEIPAFENWNQCWRILSQNNILWRGSSIFRRTSPSAIPGPLTLRKII
ncbi:mitochondrial carrier homolog 2-like [Xenia sp. Carnegie-2017]|uniref:mitochondrial carrier homolog 2-like n=1 Tax=Xenia sp. Carnegie-2017 TaxID=2897299 RepID=UPI001F042365|nr:mitochondrial carrier homolog 2-like [Xenia sp. Carnegie-2017]